MRVFISYGRQDALDFARGLAKRLRVEGFDTWLDKDNGIAPGDRFDLQIELGIRNSDVLMAILSPWSARDSSFCRNEILFAQAHKLPVVPIRIADVDPPIQIYSVQYIDIKSEGDAALDRVMEVLRHLEEHGSVPAALPDSPSLPFSSWLDAEHEDISGDLAEHGGRFHGREWLFEQIGAWIDEHTSRLLLLTAPPGYGKSALCAQMTTRFDVYGIHFCRATRTRSCKPAHWVIGLIRQLAGQLEPYREEIADRGAPDPSDPRSLFRDWVADPLNRCRERLRDTAPKLFVIDGLDEAVAVGGQQMADVILECIPYLPDWLRILVTCRPDDSLQARFRTEGVVCLTLTQDDPQNLDDLESYLRTTLSQAGRVEETAQDVQDLVRDLRAEAAGNFLFAAVSLEALSDPDPAYRLSPSELGGLPGKLNGLYHLMFRKRFPDIEMYESTIAPVLDCLASAKGPLPADIMGTICGLNARTVRRGLRPLSQFLVSGTDGLSFFHKSVVEWLADERASAEFAADLEEGWARLGRYCLQQHAEGAEGMSPYALKYLLSYVAEDRNERDSGAVLADPEFLLRFVRELGVGDLLHDLTLIRSHASDVEAISGALRLAGHILFGDPNQLPVQLAARLWSFDSPLISDMLARVNDLTTDRLRPISSPLAKPDSHLLFMLRPHAAGLAWCRIDPGRNRFITVGMDGELKIWDAGTGTQVAETQIPLTGPVASQPIMSNDGNAVAVNCGDRIVVWNIPDGRCIGEAILAEPSPGILALCTPNSGPRGRPLRVQRRSHGANVLWLDESFTHATALIRNGRNNEPYSLRSSYMAVWDLQARTTPAVRRNMPHGASLFHLNTTCTHAAYDIDSETIRIRELADGRTVRHIHLEKGIKAIEALHFDRRKLRIAFADGEIHTFGMERAADEPPDGYLTPIVTGRLYDGHLFVKGITEPGSSQPGPLRLLEPESGATVLDIDGLHGTPVLRTKRGYVVSRHGNDLVMYDTASGREVRRLEGHVALISSVSATTDLKHVLTGAEDDTVRMWDLDAAPDSRWEAAGDSPAEQSLFMLGDSGRVLQSLGGSLRIWDLASARITGTATGHDGFIRAFDLSKDGRQLATGSDQGDVLIWDTQTLTPVRTIRARGPRVEGLRFLENGDKLAVVASKGRVTVWDVAREEQVSRIDVGGYTSLAAAEKQNPGRLAMADASHAIMILERLVDPRIVRCAVHSDTVFCLAFDTSGSRLVSASIDGSLCVWNASDGTLEWTIEWSPDVPVPLRLLDAAQRRGGAVAKARARRRYRGFLESSPDDNFFVLTPDGMRLLIPTGTHSLEVWSLETGALLYQLTGHTGKISAILPTADAKRAITVSYDGSICHWDLEAAALLDRFSTDSPLTTAVIDPIGRFVAAADIAGRLHIMVVPRPH